MREGKVRSEMSCECRLCLAVVISFHSIAFLCWRLRACHHRTARYLFLDLKFSSSTASYVRTLTPPEEGFHPSQSSASLPYV